MGSMQRFSITYNKESYDEKHVSRRKCQGRERRDKKINPQLSLQLEATVKNKSDKAMERHWNQGDRK